MTAENSDLDFDLEITNTSRRASGGGTWVSGTLDGRYRFEALVFPKHAENPEWEIGESRISKLWVQCLSNKQTVFNWDRGLDVPAADRTTQAVVDFLGEGLASFVYAD